MNIDKTKIDTSKAIFPQIYAYNLPDVVSKDGWVKIGYTERQNVHIRIKEQVGTVDLDYNLLWNKMARFKDNRIFSDHQLHAYLKKYKNRENKPNTEWFFYNGTPLKSLDDFKDFINQNFNQASEQLDYQLRDEQQEAVNLTLEYFNNNPNGEFLWNAKPRFGKTLTTYDLVRQLHAKTVLIVTNRPAIANSWFDDFEKFIAWQTDFVFVSTADTLKNRPVLTREQFLNQMTKPNGKKDMIAFISLQDLKGAIYFGGQYDKLAWVKEIKWNLLVIDEAHEGVDTLKTDVAFDNINRDFTLHLSGTPFKALASGSFVENKIYHWTYADEQSAKLNWASDEESNPYATLPTLNLFSYQMSQMISDKVNQGADIDGNNVDSAFDLNEFFATDDKGKFIREKAVKKWLNTLSNNEKYPFSTKELRDEIKHSFWLLNRVDSAKALAKLLNNHPVFENYHIVLAVGDGRNDENDVISSKALDRVKQAIKNNDKTITLSVGQLTTGVTVPEWTAVMMLSNVKSSPLYMQTAFRAQNAWQYEKDGQLFQKKNAYVFDFAPERTLTIYDEFANNLSLKTSNGNGTTSDRENNIKELLNFFPVIAEDNEGKMVELDVNQVLTIPKMIKATEVVRHKFLSNFLFANIDRVFGNVSGEIKNVLDKLGQLKVPEISSITTINTDGIELDNNGDVIINQETVININNAKFGQKIYGEIYKNTDEIIDKADTSDNKLSKNIVENIINHSKNSLKELANEYNLSEKFAEKVLKENSQNLIKTLDKLQQNTQIKYNELENNIQNLLKTVQNDDEKQQILANYEQQKMQIEQEFKYTLSETVQEQVEQFTQNSTESILQRAKEKQKDEQENNIGKTLNKFSRTIPMFLMAYGDKNINLANFDSYVSDEVFQEVTTLSLAEFRLLRDEGKFFDEQVFDTSVQEFLNKRQALANYFDENQNEDIFDIIPPQKNNQIFTPKRVVKMMMDKFEQQNPDIFKNPNITFADLYMKSGLYITEIVKRLYIGLENEFPNSQERLAHIFANQVYGFAPSEIIYHIAKNFILGFDENQDFDHSHIVHLDTTPYAKGEADFNEKLTEIFGKAMKFDVVVGNPPYQDNIEHREEQPSIYQYFYDLAEKYGNRYCLISPARFLFNVGSTPTEWNRKMLNDEHLKVLYFNGNPKGVFDKNEIKGGVAIVYRDSDIYFGKIGIFTSYNELNNILEKVITDDFTSIGELLHSNTSYKYSQLLWQEKPTLISRVSGGSKRYLSSSVFDNLHELFFDENPNDNKDYIQILGRQNNSRVFKWLRRDYLAKHPNMDKYKVLIPSSNGSGKLGEVLSTPIIETPNQGHTETFISLGAFDDKLEAENLLKYIKTKFSRLMLGVVKVTQGNKTKEVWSKVPLQDFTANSDIDWTQSIADIDKQLYQKYGLSDDEIAFIETKVKAMI